MGGGGGGLLLAQKPFRHFTDGEANGNGPPVAERHVLRHVQARRCCNEQESEGHGNERQKNFVFEKKAFP